MPSPRPSPSPSKWLPWMWPTANAMVTWHILCVAHWLCHLKKNNLKKPKHPKKELMESDDFF